MNSVVIAIIVAVAVGVSAAYLLYRSVQIVPNGREQVVERFGRYHRTLQPGLRLLVPVADFIRSTADMREQVLPFPLQEVITVDHLLVYIDWIVHYQVTDARRATYASQNYVLAMEYLVSTKLRTIVGSIDLEHVLMSRELINAELQETLVPAAKPWGIQINRVDVRQILPTRKISKLMEKQVRAKWEQLETATRANAVAQQDAGSWPHTVINHGIMASGNSLVAQSDVASRSSGWERLIPLNGADGQSQGKEDSMRDNKGVVASGHANVVGNAIATGHGRATVANDSHAQTPERQSGLSPEQIQALLRELTDALAEADHPMRAELTDAVEDASEELDKPAPRLGKLRFFAQNLTGAVASASALADLAAKIEAAIRAL